MEQAMETTTDTMVKITTESTKDDVTSADFIIVSATGGASTAGAAVTEISSLREPESTTTPGNETQCVMNSSSTVATVGDGSLEKLCQEETFKPAEMSTLQIAAHSCLGVVCLLGLVLCAVFLRAMRKTRTSKVSSRWCLASVIVCDFANGLMQLFAVTAFFSKLLFEIRSLDVLCALRMSQVIFNFWTSLPSLFSLLTLALDQLLAIAFPMQTHTKSKDRLKKIIFTLIIWGPSALFSLAALLLWLTSNDWTCSGMMQESSKAVVPFGITGVACLGLNVIVYFALFVKIVCYRYFNRLSHSVAASNQRDQGESANKQRSLVLVFSAIFLANTVFWLPPWIFFAVFEECKSFVAPCYQLYADIHIILMIFYQFNSIFDPLFLAWRFPVIGRVCFSFCCRGDGV